MDNKRRIGEELLSERGKLGLTRKQLSDKTGVSSSVIQNYEDNKSRFSVHTFLSLCEGLNIDPVGILAPELTSVLIESGAVNALTEDPPEDHSSPEYKTYLFDKESLEECLAGFPSDEVLGFFKEKYSQETFRNLFVGTARKIEKNIREGNQQKKKGTSSINQRPESMVSISDGFLKMTPKMYREDELLLANYAQLNEEGQADLYFYSLQLLTDPDKRKSRKTDDSIKEE